jgi:hypothetical protein
MAIGYQNNARHPASRAGIDPDDSAVRHRAAPKNDVRHAGQLNIINVRSLTLNELACARTLNALSDVARVLGHIVQGLISWIDLGALLDLGAGMRRACCHRLVF